MRLAERIFASVVCKIAETFEGRMEEWEDKLQDIKDLAEDAELIWKSDLEIRRKHIQARQDKGQVQHGI